MDSASATVTTTTRVAGKIVEIIGPTISVEFPEGHLPSILSAIEVTRPETGEVIVSEVAQHLGNNIVKCICMDNTDGLQRGMEAVDTGVPITIPVGAGVPGPAVQRDSGSRSTRRARLTPSRFYPIHREAPSLIEQNVKMEVLETGIKVVDLLAPYLEGRQDRPVRRRGRGQDGADPGADPQHRHGARRQVGVRRRRRAHARGQRPLPRNDGIGRDQADGDGLRADERAARRAPARGAQRADDGGVLPRRRGPGRAAVHRQHLPLHPGGLRSVGAAGPPAQRGGLPADAGRSRWARCRSASLPR